jgi:hypothetical protein
MSASHVSGVHTTKNTPAPLQKPFLDDIIPIRPAESTESLTVLSFPLRIASFKKDEMGRCWNARSRTSDKMLIRLEDSRIRQEGEQHNRPDLLGS